MHWILSYQALKIHCLINLHNTYMGYMLIFACWMSVSLLGYAQWFLCKRVLIFRLLESRQSSWRTLLSMKRELELFLKLI